MDAADYNTTMSRLLRSLALAVFALGFSQAADAPNLTAEYHATADRLIDSALADTEGYNRLAHLCDRIGNRLSGSPALDEAIAWAADQMKSAGLSNVRLLPVKVPHWVRGKECARIVAPVERQLHMLGLGMSVGTPPGGVTAEAVVVPGFDGLANLGREKVQGKIVVYNEPYRGYGETVAYRRLGASRAAELGAVAALVRSIAPLAMQIPHTGTMRYADGPPKIPTAAISIEDAMMLARLVDEGLPVKVHLEMGAHFEPDADSANVIGEIPGREMPDEVVAVGGHIDSWDVGQGAQDDGVGIMASLEAVALIHKLGLKPRRTIRVVFWVNEENGQRGANAYRDWLGSGVNRHVAAIEMDGGAETPRGFGFGTEKGGNPQSVATLKEIGKLLDRVGAGAILPNGEDADTEPLIEAGVPGLADRTVGAHYFDWHHTETDTLDKVNPEDFRKNVAALAVMTYVLADMPQRLKP